MICVLYTFCQIAVKRGLNKRIFQFLSDFKTKMQSRRRKQSSGDEDFSLDEDTMNQILKEDEIDDRESEAKRPKRKSFRAAYMSSRAKNRSKDSLASQPRVAKRASGKFNIP
jgi:uncharacterized protein YlaI